MSRQIIYTILFILSLLPIQRGLAASYKWQALTLNEGLTGSTAYTIHKDKEGYVWIGTDQGLNRFDGFHLKLYTDEKGKPVPVNTFTETADGELWAGNSNGLYSIDRAKGVLRSSLTKLIHTSINTLAVDGQTLYVGSNQGVFIRQNGKWTQTLLKSNPLARENHVRAICLGGGFLWTACETGLYRISNTGHAQLVSPFPPYELNCLTWIDGKLYIGTRTKGIVAYTPQTKTLTPFFTQDKTSVKTLSSHPLKKEIYAGMDGSGIYILPLDKAKAPIHYQHIPNDDQSLRSNSVYSLLVDKEGIIWTGYFQMGVDYTLYQNGRFTLYELPPLFSSRQLPVRTITLHGSQRVIGTREGLWFIDEAKKIVRHYTTPLLRSNMIFSTLFHMDTYYIATGNGIYTLNPHTGALSPFKPAPDFQEDVIFNLAEGHDGSLWIGTSTGVYQCKDGQTIAHLQMNNSNLPGNIVYRIYFDRIGRGWIFTNAGTCLYDSSDKTVHTDVFPEGFPWKNIRDIWEDRHTLYFITDKNTILTSDSKLTHCVPYQSELFQDGKKARFIIGDQSNGLWIGTDRGLFHTFPNGQIQSFSFEDGIPAPVFFNCQPAQDEQGRIWFGNSQGLILWDANKKIQTHSYPVQVTESVQKEQGVLTLRFSDFSYSDPQSPQLEYQMEGVDDGWKETTAQAEATYYGLSSGTHIFKIRRKSDPASEVEIPVRTGGMSWKFSLLIVLAGIGVALFVYFKKKKRSSTPRIMPLSPAISSETVNHSPDKYKNNKLDEETCKDIETRLTTWMKEKKPYLKKTLKLKDAVKALKIPDYQLSYVLNIHMHIRYNDFVNNYRVEEFKRIVEEKGNERYTIEALSDQCGFSSKTSFFRHFKRVEGITPNEYANRQLN